MKRVRTLAHNPVPNVMPAELSQPRCPNLDTLEKNATSATNPYLNIYSTSLTPYACTCSDSMHMRRMLHLAPLVLFADRFVISPLILSTFYFILYAL